MIKKHLAVLSVTVLAPLFSGASILPNDVNLCEKRECTEQMLGIQKDFDENKHFAIAEGDVGLYSGACYHLAHGVDPKQEHHGLALFETGDHNVINYQGLFSFFATSNPYAGMDVAAARARLTSYGSTPYPVMLEPGQGHVVISYGDDGKIDYWFHSTDDGSKLFLLSRWEVKGAQQTSFCRFEKH
ncbi:MAG: hypothetical protein KF802_12440 [Bdellovibrionaceae bacterium]|nr:hypothetical protein [Pseudobdellovibrionaceae bacterium]MBX3034674.1 hypothetical protein [Pseudobdellovibrionaceae bacterium]